MISNSLKIKRTHIGVVDFIAGAIIVFSAVFFFQNIPELSSMIKDLAARTGYGSAKQFFFIVENPPPYLILTGIYILCNALYCFVAGYSLLKTKRWGVIFNYVLWGLEFINLALVTILILVISGI